MNGRVIGSQHFQKLRRFDLWWQPRHGSVPNRDNLCCRVCRVCLGKELHVGLASNGPIRVTKVETINRTLSYEI